ncbi:uncharacterized protein LOC126840729 [Adelges cooleyi]|uniref:uncharacterized protein LOC126840729 n=1 Tax=Adelges cooleyi TaxID=133065 RepID=UPI00217F3A95|nr:uncharacterized protein LOC126840729 [Adelges cooleyi]
MKLYKPLQVCGYFLGAFPCFEHCDGFRVHWIGVTFKAVFLLLYWKITIAVIKISLMSLSSNGSPIKNKNLTSRVLNIDAIYVYMLFSESATTLVCQLQFFRPSVYQLVNDCFYHLCRLDDVSVTEQYFSAFSVVMLVLYEVAMYFILIQKRSHRTYKFYWLHVPLSNLACIMLEQFFYLMCISLYMRLGKLHQQIKGLLDKAERPRWKCWMTTKAGGPTRLGIPAFSASDIQDLRSVHRACMDMFKRVNRVFQLPVLLCLVDSGFRIVVFLYSIAFDVTIVVWGKKDNIDYETIAVYVGYILTRIFRVLYLHVCEYYVTKEISPISLSLSNLTLLLNPIARRRLMPEIVLFQAQLKSIKSRFNIFNLVNVNIALLYAESGTVIAYTAFMLQFFALEPVLNQKNSTIT